MRNFALMSCSTVLCTGDIFNIVSPTVQGCWAMMLMMMLMITQGSRTTHPVTFLEMMSRRGKKTRLDKKRVEMMRLCATQSSEQLSFPRFLKPFYGWKSHFKSHSKQIWQSRKSAHNIYNPYSLPKGQIKHSPSVMWWAVISYRTSRWFCDFSGSKATSPDSQVKARMQLLTAPFGTDNSASWERETDRFSPDKDKVNGPKTPAFISCLLPSIDFYIFTITSPFRHLILLHRRTLVKLYVFLWV